MPDLILHHYAGSPFSEKVRLILGFKGLAWRSVMVPNVMPKPDVVALTGGYRRTPFMQIGADIYCDTALMCRVIDAIKPEPPLYPASTSGIAEIVAQWADTTLFWTAVPFTLQPAGAVHVLKDATPEMLKAFGADRAAMNPNMKRATIADGAAALGAYLVRLEHLLADGQPFLLGALPSIADFSAAQSIWFIHLAPPVAEVLAAYPKVAAWYARVRGFGHGTFTKMKSAEAIEVATQGGHVPLSFTAEPGLAEGDDVTVMPTDYAHDAVAGKLVGLSPREVVIARTDERAGAVHVHFPRIAFQIKRLQPA
ncbi:MAG: glutathione S-transferase family protein [Rhizobiales bacterium]|nr:glutathione S-transferase family protein [Rhizobacter sp.]